MRRENLVRVLGLLIPLLMGACECQQPPPGQCLGEPFPVDDVGQTAEGLFLTSVGQSFSLTVPSPSSGCSASPTRVTVEVLDPENRPVAATATLTKGSSGGFGAGAAEIDFFPAVPGPYHVAVQFQPNLGLKQFTVSAVRQRNDALVFSGAKPCVDVQRVGGALLCLTADQEVDRLHDGRTDFVASTKGLATGAGKMWTWDDAQIHLWGVDGGVPVMTESIAVSVVNGSTDPDGGFIAYTTSEWYRVQPRQSGLTSERVGWTSGAQPTGAPLVVGAAVAWAFDERICISRLSALSSVPACTQPGVVLAPDSTGFWVLTPEAPLGPALLTVLPGQGTLSQGASVLPEPEVSWATRKGSLPMRLWKNQLVLPQSSTAELHAFPLDREATANVGFVWQNLPDGGLTVFER